MEDNEITIKQALEIGVKAHNQGKLNEAETIYKNILDKAPSNTDALHLLGVIKHQLGNHKEAIEKITKAIQLKSSAIYYGNLGMAYNALGKDEEAAESFKKALEINPRYEKAYLAHYNLGIYFKDKGEILRALEHYNKSIELNDFPEAHWNKSLVLLLLGRFKEGWREYNYRFKKEKPSDNRVFLKPEWKGELLKGKKILILSEQGFGDNIQFIRYIPQVKEKRAYIILECKKELIKLFKSLEIDDIVEKSKIIPNVEHDFYIHLMSLPGIFNTDLTSIPNNPYLKADKELAEKFRAKLNSEKFKIGIVWTGNPQQENDKTRSTTFEKFKTLKIPGVELFSLQIWNASKQLDSQYTVDLSNEINDFADTAAIIENLDLIISVDTSVAHLTGAMGKPVWTLLSFIPDWRYMLERKDCPWYPSMKLFRQKSPGDWSSVFEEVKKELETLVKNRS